MIAIILVLVQFIVHFVAFQYSGSDAALGYFSISGTMVSIILAFLAIIYSYYQSASQASSSSALNMQIDKLISVVDVIGSSKSDFADELKQLSVISDKIDSSISLQRQFHAQVREISGAVEEMRANRLAGIYKGNDDYFTRLVVEGDNLIHLTLLVIRYSSEYGIESKNIDKELTGPAIRALHKGVVPSELRQFYRISMSSILSVFKALGYVSEEGDDFPLAPSDEFHVNLEKFQEFISSRDDEQYKAIISALEASVHNGKD